MKQSQPNAPPRSETFETAIDRLEQIAIELEKPDIGLDESVRLFREGKKLAAVCEGLLAAAQQSIEAAVDESDAGRAAPSQAPGTLFDSRP